MKNKITIAEPCMESWEHMAQTGKADCAFCQSCQKEVIDFTQKSDREIIKIMNSQKNFCGKFTQNQIDKTYQTSENFSIPYKWAMASLFSGLMLTQPAFSQSKKEKTPAVKTVSEFTSSESRIKIQPEIEGKDSTNTRTVSGVVKDDTGEVLPGASVTVKGTNINVATNTNGEYSIEVPEYEDFFVLLFEYSGYEPKEVVSVKYENINATLNLATIHLEEFYVVADGLTSNSRETIMGLSQSITVIYCEDGKPETHKKSFWQRIKNFPRWITSPFRKKHD